MLVKKVARGLSFSIRLVLGLVGLAIGVLLFIVIWSKGTFLLALIVGAPIWVAMLKTILGGLDAIGRERGEDYND